MKGTKTKKELSPKDSEGLLKTLKSRFEKNMNRHESLEWSKVQAKLERAPEKLWSLNEMEITGGEPDVVGFNKKTGEYAFYDCSAESPSGRRSVCYDREALDARKEHKPKNSAMDMAAAMGIEILTEDQYGGLQELLDKFLWFARIVKTRALAQQLAEEGRLRVNGRPVDKAHAVVRVGDVLTFARHGEVRVLKIEALPVRRGAPAEARALYSELTSEGGGA